MCLARRYVAISEGDDAMKKMLIETFVEGFTGAFRLAVDLVVAVAKAIVAVSSDFVNNRPRGFLDRGPRVGSTQIRSQREN
jgi:hypothetical protein